MARLASVRKTFDSRLTAAQNLYEYNYNQRERYTKVLKTNWLVFFNTPSPEVDTNDSKKKHRPT